MSRMILVSFFCFLFSTSLFGTGGAAVQFSPPAVADQDAPIVLAQAERRGLFGTLFGKRREVLRNQDRRQEEVQPSQPVRKQRRNKTKTTAGIARVETPPEVVEKADDARTVLVVGDFMANALAKGMIDALSSNPEIRIVNASNGSSGLVRDDFYNWNTNLPRLVAEHKANLIVVMVGANDRQTIRTDGKSIDVGDTAWKAAYNGKVTEFADVLSAQGVPVMWMGLAPVAKSVLSREYSGFNSMYRQKSELKGFKFVDIWNGFADDTGQYVERGPDINGQTRTLRGESGLSFTDAGRRKLAFFVERDVVRFLDDDQAALLAALPGASGAGPAVSAMMPIESISIRPGSELSIAPGPAATEPPANPERASNSEGPEPLPAGETTQQVANTEGSNTSELSESAELASGYAAGSDIPVQPVTAPVGRADNYSWPPPQ